MLTEKRSYGGDITWTLCCDGKHLLALGASTIMQHRFEASTLYPAHHLEYLLGAVDYHCARLAELYVQIAANYCRIQKTPGFSTESDTGIFQNQTEPYYEFEALVGTARRAYDSMRYLLWPRFGSPNGSLPRSLEAVLKSHNKMPSELRQRLSKSWEQFGVPLTDYRDCLHHYVPIDFGLASAFMRRHSTGAWTTMIRIPDNPESRSKRRFTFNLNRDALTYAWELANEIFSIAVQVAQATLPATEN